MSRSRADRGTVLVVILILLVVASLVGVWSLSSTRQGIWKAGTMRGLLTTQYWAEEALQKAVRRMQQIADANETDTLGNKDIALLLSLCVPACESPPHTDCPTVCTDPDPACNEDTFNPATNLDVISVNAGGTPQNVICNFMGTALKRTQVQIARKEDVFDVPTQATNAVYLLTAISKDEAARRRIVQGVAILPYEKNPFGGYRQRAGEKVYLTTWSKASGS